MLPPFLAFLGITLMAVVTVSGTFFGGSTDVLDARVASTVRTVELNGTAIELVSATYSGDVATLTFRNTGRVALRASESWDVWAAVHDTGGTFYPELLARGTTASASADEWVLHGLYLDAESTSAEAFQPGIWNPGEEAIFTLNIEPDALDPDANLATLALPSGIAAHAAFTWEALTDATAATGAGAAIASDGTYVYAMRGGSTADFYRYATTGAWDALTDVPFVVGAGGALAYAEGDGAAYVYALRGDSQVDFERFLISDGTWSTQADVPANAGDGAAMAWDGLNTIYALRGNGVVDFWAYNIANNTWSTKGDAPGNVGAGGGLAYVDGALYTLGGGTTTDVWAYDVATTTWSTIAATPATVGAGGSLATDGVDLYALRGGTQSTFWKYSVARDNWTELPVTPTTVAAGGAVHVLNDVAYGLRGNSTATFWKYPLPVYEP